MGDPLALPAFARFVGGGDLFGFTYIAWAGSELWIVSRDRVKVVGARLDRGSLIVIALTIPAAIVLAFELCRLGRATVPLPPQLLTGLGIALMLGGIAFRLWSVRTLGRFFRVRVTTHDDHRLIESGPYRRLRNPSYTGAMTTMLGLGIALGNALSIAAMIALPLAAFAWRIRVEEASLGARFGPAWEAFRARRWALVPFVW